MKPSSAESLNGGEKDLMANIPSATALGTAGKDGAYLLQDFTSSRVQGRQTLRIVASNPNPDKSLSLRPGSPPTSRLQTSLSSVPSDGISSQWVINDSHDLFPSPLSVSNPAICPGDASVFGKSPWDDDDRGRDSLIPGGNWYKTTLTNSTLLFAKKSVFQTSLIWVWLLRWALLGTAIP
ncbi:hypothetical protein NE237_022236 [Protea cynaroides]|uniref:Uncharacterized protein n=1 Tax=Protea cynaroides TaxID=273540 RepID=A0A9Q0K499_9MAGN|nr:hypothetical protein NE237_022236 [Protea cynaroides]